MQQANRRSSLTAWIARAAVGIVFGWNLSAALAFLARPERYAAGFELAGPAGEAMVRGLGVLFLMWNATFPLVILQPRRHTTLFVVILIQQALAAAGETWIWFGLPAQQAVLRETGVRFIALDGAGLVVMAIAFALLRSTQAQ